MCFDLIQPNVNSKTTAQQDLLCTKTTLHQNTTPTVKHGGSSIMLRDCFPSSETGTFFKGNEIMNGIKYYRTENLQVHCHKAEDKLVYFSVQVYIHFHKK
ncbi:hypothetical protein ILYODFUR_035511 [Ilyodon furcidens]|uniref:Uncharacterized protein n=1 Tax=Ilyodon furcidens TaxID=33524 RepID=A0ABV0VKG6_9TELE